MAGIPKADPHNAPVGKILEAGKPALTVNPNHQTGRGSSTQGEGTRPTTRGTRRDGAGSWGECANFWVRRIPAPALGPERVSEQGCACVTRTASLQIQRLNVWFAATMLALITLPVFGGPYSSPTALRDTNDYARAISPVAPGALNLQALDHVSLTQDGESLLLTMPFSGAEDANDGFEHAVRRLKPGEKLEGAGAAFEMVAFAASGPGISKITTNKDKTVPLDCFAPDGRRLAADELKALGFRKWELSESSIGSSSGVDYAFPNLRISLGSIKEPPGYYTVVGLFDARTKRSLVSGFSYSGIASNQLGHINVHPRAWHATPMELVLDVHMDGKVVIETNVIPGMRVAVPGGELKLLGVRDGHANSWSSTGGSAKTPATMQINLRPRDGETNAVALFVTEPTKLAVQIDLLDGEGRLLPSDGGGTGGLVRFVGCRGVAAEVKRARFTVFTNHHRVVCDLPPIPNLPNTTKPVANLFDVAIPRVQIQQEYQLRDVIGNMTQMTFVYPPFGDTMPAGLFPLDFTNITPAQLLVEYAGYLTNGYGVVVDEKKNEIRVEPTQFEKLKRWIKQKLP